MSASVVRDMTLNHGADALADGSPSRLAKLRTFHTLDALRGVAALTIVAFHAAFMYRIDRPAEGQIAVDLFFVMSGFIVAYRYEDDLGRGMSLARFVKVRLIRLYPLFILGACLGALPAVVAILTGHGDAFYNEMMKSLPLAVLMLPSRYAVPSVDELYPLNYVAWSLALELLVNVAYAATFRIWTIKRLLVLIAVAFVGLCVCAKIFGTLKYGYAWAQAEVGPVRIIYGFAMGVLLCRLHQRRPFAVRMPWWIIVAAALALFFFDAPWKPVWEVLAVTVLVPGIVVLAIANEPPRRVQGACAFAGIMSYVLYSLHAPFIGLFLRGEDRLHVDLSIQTRMDALVFSVLLLALCLVAHYVYDKPIRRILTRRMGANRAARSNAPSIVPGHG